MAARKKANDKGLSQAYLARIAAALERLAPAATLQRGARDGRCVRLGASAGRAGAGGRGRRMFRSACSRASIRRATRCWRTRAASPTACPPTMRCCGARAAWARASLVKAVHAEVNRSRKGAARLVLVEIHREEIASLPLLLRLLRGRAAALPALLRRSFLRQGRHQLQIAEGGARRRHRGTAGECAVLRHVQPPPSDAARHDGERALHRDQSVRSGGRKSFAVGPLRTVARLPQLRAGRISRDDRRLCGAFRIEVAKRIFMRRAIAWAAGRGSRSGRVAWQFIQDLAGELGKKLVVRTRRHQQRARIDRLGIVRGFRNAVAAR